MTKIIPSPQWLDKGTYKEPVDGDNIRVPRLEVDDATTFIDKDGSNNMTFEDAVTGSKTLAQLATGGVTNFADLDDVKVVRKSADQTLDQSSTTMQDVTEMLFAVGANEVWHFSVYFKFNSGTVPDIKVQFAVPTGGNGEYFPHGYIGASTGSSPIAPETITTSRPQDGAGYNRVTLLQGLYWGGANAGNIQLQAAQNTADASDTKVLANSSIIAHKLA